VTTAVRSSPAHETDPATIHRQAASWPYLDLDVDRLRATGWLPTPVRDIVLKVHQRCNLACDYCYVYTGEDRSWRERPAAMSPSVGQAAVARIAGHVTRHELRSIRVILHGGEPLLFGLDRIEEFVEALRSGVPRTCDVEVGLQTNGVLLTSTAVDRLRRAQVRVGVSLDGTADNHDRHRRTHAGRGTFAAVARALDLLRTPINREVYGGILTTVAIDTDPIATYDQLLAFEPPMIDFLLPHANWQSLPPGAHDTATPYGNWLVSVFDRWYASSDPIRVRLFDDLISLLLGGTSRSEQVGLSPAGMIVIESDGAIEQVDVLKSAYSGACATGLNVLDDDLDAALANPGIIARQIGLASLSDTCRTCPVQRICGGGHYAHRYRAGSGFRHPSVYCHDLRLLIDHISQRISTDIRRHVPGPA
jgi:uncharacterized protein